jgi:hypothetical protein
VDQFRHQRVHDRLNILQLPVLTIRVQFNQKFLTRINFPPFPVLQYKPYMLLSKIVPQRIQIILLLIIGVYFIIQNLQDREQLNLVLPLRKH